MSYLDRAFPGEEEHSQGREQGRGLEAVLCMGFTGAWRWEAGLEDQRPGT